MSNKNRKNDKLKNNNKSLNALKYLIFGILVIVAIFIISFNATSVNTTLALNDTVEDKIISKGIITCEEELFVSDMQGEALFMYADGERVIAKKKVATVYSGDLDQETKEKLKKANDKMRQAEINSYFISTIANDPVAVKNAIKNTTEEISVKSNERDYSSVYELKNNLEIYTGYLKSSNNSTSPKSFEDMKQEVASIEQSIKYNKNTYYSKTAGIFSTNIDGFETLLKPIDIPSINISNLNTLFATKPTINSKITPQYAFAKVINNYEWNLVASFNINDISNLNIGSAVKLRIPSLSSSSVTATVTYISDKEEDGKKVAAFISSIIIPNVYTSRIVDFELVRNEATGLKVPIESLVTKDNKTGVYVIKDSVVQFVEINKIYEGKNFVIVKDLSNETAKNKRLILYDLIILNPKSVTEGQIVRDYS